MNNQMPSGHTLWELVVAAGLILLLVFIDRPLELLTSTAMLIIIAAIFTLFFLFFAFFLWNDGAKDERERAHSETAGRIGYIAGMTIAGVGIVIQMFHNMYEVDQWLILVFAGMVLTKIIGQLYTQLRK